MEHFDHVFNGVGEYMEHTDLGVEEISRAVEGGCEESRRCHKVLIEVWLAQYIKKSQLECRNYQDISLLNVIIKL